MSADDTGMGTTREPAGGARESAPGTSPRWFSGRFSVALALALSAAPLVAQTFVPPLRAEPADSAPSVQGADGADDSAARRATLGRLAVHARLEGVTGSEFEAAVLELRAPDSPAAPRELEEALILRAGAPVPVGLTAARAARRATMREEALALLRRETAARDDAAEATEEGETPTETATETEAEAGPGTDSGAGVPDWEARLRECLTDTGRRELWCAAANVAAALERDDLAELVAAPLGADDAVLAACARRALAALYERRFATLEDFAAFRERSAGLRRDQLALGDLAAARQELARRLSRLIELDANEALAALEHPDPDVRAPAAEAVARGVGEGKVSAQTAIEALSARVETEVEPKAYHAALKGLLGLLAGAPADSGPVERVRAVLDRAVSGDRALAWIALEALSKLPWQKEAPEGPAGLGAGIARVARGLGELVDPARPLDADLLITGVESLRTMCLRMGEGEGPLATWAEPAREALLFLMRDYAGSQQVRLAAAATISFVVSPADAETLVEVIGGEHSFPALRYELLGSLGRVSERLPPDSAGSRLALETLLAYAADADLDVRRRALGVLAGEKLAPLVAAGRSPELLAALVERLHAEVARERVEAKEGELVPLLLGLLGRFRDPGLVEEILHSRRFVELAVGSPRRIGEVSSALRKLGGTEPRRLMRIAQALVHVSAGHAEPLATRAARLEAALGLLAELDEPALRALSPVEHDEVVGWAAELRSLSGSRPGGPETLRPHLARLVGVHLPLSAAMEHQDPCRLALRRAVFTGDRLVAGAIAADVPGAPPRVLANGEVDAVLAHYAEALRARTEVHAAGVPAAGGAVCPAREVILRDRARFLTAVDRDRDALADYRALLPLGPEAPRPFVAPPGLDLSDLREAAALLAGPVSPSTERARQSAASDAFEVSHALVHRAAWHQEPRSVRLQDLRDLATRAQTAGPPAVQIVRDLLADLPAEALPSASPDTPRPGQPTPPGAVTDLPVWDGFRRRPELHAALLELRASLAAEPGRSPPSPVPLNAADPPESAPVADPNAASQDSALPTRRAVGSG